MPVQLRVVLFHSRSAVLLESSLVERCRETHHFLGIDDRARDSIARRSGEQRLLLRHLSSSAMSPYRNGSLSVLDEHLQSVQFGLSSRSIDPPDTEHFGLSFLFVDQRHPLQVVQLSVDDLQSTDVLAGLSDRDGACVCSVVRQWPVAEETEDRSTHSRRDSADDPHREWLSVGVRRLTDQQQRWQPCHVCHDVCARPIGVDASSQRAHNHRLCGAIRDQWSVHRNNHLPRH